MSTKKTEVPAEPPTLAEERAAWAGILGEREERAAAMVAAQREVDEYTRTYRRPPPETLERKVGQARGRLAECDRCRVRLMDTAAPRDREHFRDLGRVRKELTEAIAREVSRQADFTRRVAASIAVCERRAQEHPERSDIIDLDKRTVSAMQATVRKYDAELLAMRERLVQVNLEAEVARAKMLRP